MGQFHRSTLTELVNHLQTGTCKAVDIVQDILQAVDARDGMIGAYLTMDRKQAMADATVADELRAAGDARPFLGIPVAIKDLLSVKGQPCTCSSKILEGYTAPYDATAIAKLREAGMIMLGRVNMDEFAMGSSTENAALGSTSNPWNIEHVPGGSSGGSAASVAADLAIASLGSDTGGSIRQPAAFCGCVGLKPSYGRVSRFGLTAFASSLDQIGPLSKTVKDSALLLEVISGHDQMDSSSVTESVPAYAAGLTNECSLADMKLGIAQEYFVEGMDQEVEEAVRVAIEHCRNLGAEIVDISLPTAKYAIAVYYVIATAEASSNLARFDGIRYGLQHDGGSPEELYRKTRAAGFGSEVKRRVILGTYVLRSGYYDAYYLKAQKIRTLIRNNFTEAFKRCDAILSPVTPTAAYRKGEKTNDPLKMYLDDVMTTPVNLAGNCALSVPCGFSSTGMPIGLQIIGDVLAEEAILKVGHAYEQSTEWHLRKPEGT